MYSHIIKKPAKKFIDRLPKSEQIRIVAAIEKLPDAGDIKTMKGYENLFRLRVGSYRILYSLDNGNLVVYVIDADNRGDIYKRY